MVSLVLRHDGKFAGNRIHVLGRMEVVPPRLSQRGRRTVSDNDKPKFTLDELLVGATPQEEIDWGPAKSATVHKFEPREVGSGWRFDPDQILEAAKGQGHTNILIIGELEDGSLWVSSAANAGEAMILMEKAKHQICFGED